MLEYFIAGAVDVLSDPLTLFFVFFGTGIGIIFGAIPGLTATIAVAMFLPITFNMTPTAGISTLVALYIGGISGGLISAILLNIPGTPASIATCFDGRPLAVHGQAGKAIGVGVVFSFIGTMLSLAAMIFIAPWLAELTLKFGPWEYFGVSIFSLTLIASLSGKNVVKGLTTAILGMMFASVGLAPLDGAKRFTYGIDDLMSGFAMVSVLVGLYAISEIMKAAGTCQLDDDYQIETNVHIKGFGFSMKEFISQIWNCIRSALIGIGIGILPGIGGSTSNIVAYSVAQSSSKYPERFGTGIIDGVVASETSNNATIGGAMIPLLTLGIPGDAVTAMLLGGFIVHGIQPGPLIFQNHADVVYGVFVAMIVSSFFMLVWSFGAMRFFIKVLKVPKNYLYPIIIVLCTVGAYALNSRIFDIAAIIIFGIVGFVLEKIKYPFSSFILGFVLCNTFETGLRRGLQMSNGNFAAVLNQPITMGFLVLTVISVAMSVRRLYKNSKVVI